MPITDNKQINVDWEKFDPESYKIRSDVSDYPRKSLAMAFSNYNSNDTQVSDNAKKAIEVGLKKNWVYQRYQSDFVKAFANQLVNEATFGLVSPVSEEENKRLEEVQPDAGKLGQMAGVVLPLETGTRLLSKAPGLAKMGFAGRGLASGITTGAVGAAKTLAEGGSGDEIMKAFLDDFKSGTLWGVGGEAVLSGGKAVKQWADTYVPRIYASARGKLTADSVLTYARNPRAVNDMIADGIPNRIKMIKKQTEDKMRQFILKKDAGTQLIINKIKTPINIQQIDGAIKNEIQRLDKLIAVGDESAVKAKEYLIDYNKKLFSGSSTIEAKTLREAKGVAQDMAHKFYEFKDIGKNPELAKSFSTIAGTMRKIEDYAARTVIGGQKVAKNNAAIAKLANLQNELDIDAVLGYLRPGIKPSKLIQKARRLGTQGAKAMEEFPLLQELDSLTGTNIIEQSKVLNAAIELSNPETISAWATGRSALAGMIGAASGTGQEGVILPAPLERGILGMALMSPAASRGLITTGKWAGKIGSKVAKEAGRVGYKVKIASDILDEREKRQKNKLRYENTSNQ